MILFQWSVWELIDIIVMTLAVGYIFHDVFRVRPLHSVDPLLHLRKAFMWNDFWFACSVVAPAIILHEIGHKITALSFGLSATFQAAYLWLLIGIVLKLLNFGFIFFVPAFVSISGNATPLQGSLVALAGPGVNFVLWLGSWIIIKNASALKLSSRSRYYFTLTKQINLFLFIFNMLPIPLFDGWTVYSGLFKTFF